MTALAPNGTLSIGAYDLESRMIGTAADDAPAIVMLHEGLGSVGLWGDFPDRLQAATGACVFVYSRAGYGGSTPVELPRPLDYMHIEALEILPKLLDEIGDRKSTRLNSSHQIISYAVFCLKKKNHCVLTGNTIIGKWNKIFTGAIISSQPQDVKYNGEKTFLEISDDNVIREYVTINPRTGQ